MRKVMNASRFLGTILGAVLIISGLLALPARSQEMPIPQYPMPQYPMPQYPMPQYPMPQYPMPEQMPQYPMPGQMPQPMPQYPMPGQLPQPMPQYPMPGQMPQPMPQYPMPQYPMPGQIPQPMPQYPMPQYPQQPQAQANLNGTWTGNIGGNPVVMQINGNRYHTWLYGALFEEGYFQVNGNVLEGQTTTGYAFRRYFQLDPSGMTLSIRNLATGGTAVWQRAR